MALLQSLVGVMNRGRRVPASGFKRLTTKNGPRNYYKGKGALAPGFHTRKGGYKMLSWKLPKYIVPDLTGFSLKPYVDPSVVRPNVKSPPST